jgi:hypothetical protein
VLLLAAVLVIGEWNSTRADEATLCELKAKNYLSVALKLLIINTILGWRSMQVCPELGWLKMA